MNEVKVEKYINDFSTNFSSDLDELQFTGNWFIDAGILGFVNLMEEVYGWDLKELRRRISEEPEVVYYGYFPLAYFFNLPQSNKDKTILNKAIQTIQQFREDRNGLLETVWWKFITQFFKDRWIRNKVLRMHTKDLLKKDGKTPKDTYSDEKYLRLIREREEKLNFALSEENCEIEFARLLGKRKLFDKNKNTHKLNLNDFLTVKDKLKNLPEQFLDCKLSMDAAFDIHERLEMYLEKLWTSLTEDSYIKNLKDKKDKKKSKFFRLPIDSGFYHNYQFFNQSKGIVEQYMSLKGVLEGKISKIARDVSKFLPSTKEFPNILYTNFDISTIKREVPNLALYLICVDLGMTDVNYGNIGKILFYSSSIEFTFAVNKKLKILINQMRTRRSKYSIFKLTWSAIIDTITETRAEYSLENMYLILLYRNEIGQIIVPQTQSFVKVEYIGIPKLQASIILDDKIRDALNRNLPVKASSGKIEEQVWLLEEFIKQRPLLSHLIRYLHLYLAEDINRRGSVSKSTLVYASIIDAKVREFKDNNRLFRDYFFNSYRQLVSEIKDEVRRAFGVINSVNVLFENQDDKENYANLLLSAIKRGDKYRFTNTILKALVEKKGEEEIVRNITNFIFNRILPNDLSWKNYAIILVGGLIEGGGTYGEE